jgi:AraC-like DNA-binding protein
MTPFEIPELAIETFERLHGLNVTVHDLSGRLASVLKPFRFHHRSPLCQAVKAQGHLASCLHFELKEVRRDLALLPEGRIHVCHAGLVEWVAPVFAGNELSVILFAGPRRPGRQLRGAIRMQPTAWLKKAPWGKRRNLPAPVEDEEGHLILEHLRQLAARLQKWLAESRVRRGPGHLPAGLRSDPAATRQAVILRFIEDNHAHRVTLPMLAKKLSLSESRASHAIRECCGAGFRELLIQKRIHVARGMLRQTGMSVLEIALACGFGDVAQFHRLFRRSMGTTPARYRRDGRS